MADHERPERVLADLLALLSIADQAILLQERAEAVLQACAEPGEPAQFVAREGARVAAEYHRLWSWSLDFAPTAGDGSLERRLSDLVLLHFQLLHVAVRLAYPRQGAPGAYRSMRAVEDLTPWVAELRSVRDQLNLWITALTPVR
ncbi:MAG TPA: hypothetical protein VKZ81_27415 [Pseudonocardia sp.]|jgi:hypothetical protein|uniref:hypothetical protein n=1 Tax=Pseudonocardia sp. TaxID=60912 RepID=UPI002B4B02AA|nr:hypothetical protein [Pseudonocardia sp.]HLU59208.1 hypothetical protein [Pseudonocardia sp.]